MEEQAIYSKHVRLMKRTNHTTGYVQYFVEINGKIQDGTVTPDIISAEVYYENACEKGGITEETIKETRI
jgi:hypothetical protein